MQQPFQKPLTKLCTCAVLIALATALSELKIPLPYGGSVTFFSMVPVCLTALMFGLSWGLPTAFLYGGVQLLLGLKNLSYATSFRAVVAIIFLDYLAAFAVLGLCPIFRRLIKNQTAACAVGVAFACFLRFCCHFVTGVTVWRELVGFAAVWYSVVYNGSYMLPELILTTVGTVLLTRTAAFRRLPAKKE